MEQRHYLEQHQHLLPGNLPIQQQLVERFRDIEKQVRILIPERQELQ